MSNQTLKSLPKCTDIDQCNPMKVPIVNDNSKPVREHYKLKCPFFNFRWVVNKSVDLKVNIVKNKLDLCTLTVAWLKEDDHTSPVSLCPWDTKSTPIQGLVGWEEK